MASYDFDVVEVNNMTRLGPYEVAPSLLESGWVGGIWVRMSECRSWRDGDGIRWIRKVEVCNDTDPTYFILRGSREVSDQYTGVNPGKTGVVTCCNSGQYMFRYFEVNNKAERHIPGTGAVLVYTRGQTLYVSDRGFPEDNEGYLIADIHFP